MMRRLLLIATAVMLLPGCSAIKGIFAPPEARIARYPQADDMQSCPAPGAPADGTLASLYRHSVNTAYLYHECRDRHDNLIEWVKRGEQNAAIPPH